MPGSLIACRAQRFRDQIFYVSQGRRHQIPGIDSLPPVLLAREEEIHWVPESDLLRIPLGAPVARSQRNDPDHLTKEGIRELMAGRLQGYGVEFGAGPCPYPLPLSCRVAYADRLSNEEFCAQYSGYSPDGAPMDLVPLDFIAEVENPYGIADGSLDFAVACHVIEHTSNPIQALRQLHSKLRAGGRLLLVVPDMRRTFDQRRELTTLQHLLDDYERPSRKRDMLHYLEVYSVSFPVPAERLEWTARTACACRRDIHYHTFIYESFLELVEHIGRNLTDWAEVWSHPPVPGGDEFYFLLTR